MRPGSWLSLRRLGWARLVGLLLGLAPLAGAGGVSVSVGVGGAGGGLWVSSGRRSPRGWSRRRGRYPYPGGWSRRRRSNDPYPRGWTSTRPTRELLFVDRYGHHFVGRVLHDRFQSPDQALLRAARGDLLRVRDRRGRLRRGRLVTQGRGPAPRRLRLPLRAAPPPEAVDLPEVPLEFSSPAASQPAPRVVDVRALRLGRAPR